MAFAKITFENSVTGKTKIAPVGYSWTFLLFGFLPPLFRGDWKWGAILFVATLLTLGIAGIVFSFLYNKIYIKSLIAKGYKAVSVEVGPMERVVENLGFAL